MTVQEFATLKALAEAEKRAPGGASPAQVASHKNGAGGLTGPTLKRLADRKLVRGLVGEDGRPRYVRTARGRNATEA
jgi:hypothetical protein